MPVDEGVKEEIVAQLGRAGDFVDVGILAGFAGLSRDNLDVALGEMDEVVRSGDLVALRSVAVAATSSPPPRAAVPATVNSTPVALAKPSAIDVRDVLARLTGDASGRVRAEVWLESRSDGSMALAELIRVIPSPAPPTEIEDDGS